MASCTRNQHQGFVNADWDRDTQYGQSYVGFRFTLVSGVISWETRKQALSSTEVEYMAISEVSKVKK